MADNRTGVSAEAFGLGGPGENDLDDSDLAGVWLAASFVPYGAGEAGRLPLRERLGCSDSDFWGGCKLCGSGGLFEIHIGRYDQRGKGCGDGRSLESV